MVVIPAGSFALPSPAGSTDDVAPRVVTIPHAFAMARTEVTIAEFRAFIQATNRPLRTRCYFLFLPQYHYFDRDDVTWEHPGFGAYQASARDPVTCIDWDQAEAYAEWLSAKTGARYRLPREAFWQYAAEGGDARPVPWGDDAANACRTANVMGLEARREPWWIEGTEITHCDDRYPYTAPVGSYQPNGFGLYDMFGNVSEWTADCADAGDPERIDTGHLQEDVAPDRDCKRYVVRGGDWLETAMHIAETSRALAKWDDETPMQGFRVMRLMEDGS
jgi:formylglycine-generating enzyme required for sulfatase activity